MKNIINWIDNLDNSLLLELTKLSHSINKLLLEKNIIKKIIPDDFFMSSVENNFLFTNPDPFVILFDLPFDFAVDKKFVDGINSSKIYLFNINPIEIEFYNINLGIIRNKINEIKKELYTLVKKEKYWLNKKSYLNRSLSVL